MLEQIKKNWFVIIVAFVLLIATVFYINDQSKNKVKSKKVDGKQVVFSIDDENYFAEDFQKVLDENLGDSALFQIFRRELLTHMESSEDIQSDAKFRKESFITYVKQSEGQKGLDQVERDLIAMGYKGIDDLNTYYENELKYQELVTQTLMDNYDTLFKDEVEKNKPRLVSHILITIEDKENPSEEELEKIEKVEEALEKGTSFGDIALQYSDDQQSAQQGGSIGVVDKNSNLVKPFLDKMLELDKGEVSDWVESEFGKHIIKVEETEFEKLFKDPEFFAEMEGKHYNKIGEALWKQAESMDFVFANDEVENRIKKTLGLIKEED